MSHFARSSLIVAIFFGLDKIVGFVRALIVNNTFGLSYELDVFNAANNIPDLLSALISGGALGVALIPVLSEYLETRGREDAWELFTRILNLAFVVTAIFAVIIAIFAPFIINTFILNAAMPAEQRILAVELMRLDLFAILIFSISGLVMAGLQANQHFLLPAMAPALYNAGQIFGATVLAQRFGLGIHGLVYGVIIGAALHLLVQIPGLIKYNFKWRPGLGLRTPGVKKVLNLLGPRVLTMFFIQMFFIVRDYIASGMGEGRVSALNLGWFIMQVPETLLGTAVAIALLPTIAELVARKEMDEFRDTLNGAVRALLALTIPAALLLAVGVRPLVQAAFTSFDAEGVEWVVLATRIYLLGLAGHALIEITVRSFYAQQDAITPLIAAFLNAVTYVFLAFTLSSLWGFGGIAFANTFVFTTEALILLWLLNRKFPGLLAVRATLSRTLLGAALGGGGLFILLRLFSSPEAGRLVNAALAGGGMLVGLAVALPFILPEIRILLKLGGKKNTAAV